MIWFDFTGYWVWFHRVMKSHSWRLNAGQSVFAGMEEGCVCVAMLHAMRAWSAA